LPEPEAGLRLLKEKTLAESAVRFCRVSEQGLPRDTRKACLIVWRKSPLQQQQ
jgi:hypothetical protein